jgi:hypothetical protein
VPLPKVLLAVLVSAATLGLAPVIAQSSTAAVAPVPAHTVAVSGTDVAMYPAFAAGTHRFGVTTKDDTAGTVTVTATTTDPAGTVWVDGRPAAAGVATLTGLASGDEISVFIKDSAGTAVYALVYLPAGFPALTVTTKAPGIAPGDVFMTLTDFQGAPETGFETAVDNNGVPVYVRADTGIPLDFKRQPNGDYSVIRQPTPTPGRSGGQLVELNGSYQQIGAFETDNGLTNTDGHDSILLPNGDRYLLATEPRGGTGADADELDATIQEQAPDGHVLFTWDSKDHVNATADTMIDPSNAQHDDYAHINSISIMNNGDILASFRHLSTVMDIARTARPGVAVGDVVWRLGGRHSTFQFAAGDGGPCAQHAASELPNGNILLFDDGSEQIGSSPLLCVDPNNPSGPAIARQSTRVTEYALDPATAMPRKATLVHSFSVDGRVTIFAGSAQRLANGDTMAGWASATNTALATEFNSAGTAIWELKDAAGLSSYRALRFDAPDVIAPAVHVTTPAKGATYTFGERVTSSFGCTDRGGSSLRSCGGAAVYGAPIDTSTVGRHSYVVVAKDGARNSTSSVRHYQVTRGSARFRPDALIKPRSGGKYVGGNVYGGSHRQHIRQSISRSGRSVRARLRIQNDGNRPDRMTIRGTSGNRQFQVAYFVGTHSVSRQVRAGMYQTAVLAPGTTVRLTILVTRRPAATPRSSTTVRLSATSGDDPATRDAVATIVRATH